MNITYIGQSWGTSLHRALALKRLGHHVIIVDPWSWLGNSKWVSRWLVRLGGFGADVIINKRLGREVIQSKPDLIWVNQGEFLGPRNLISLRKSCVPIVNYMNDDPYGPNGKTRFIQFRKAIQFYDLLAVPREVNIKEAKELGAKHVMRMWFSADEVANVNRKLTPEEYKMYASDVAFVGTWMPERGSFMSELLGAGIPLSIWGNQWKKAPEWEYLKKCWRGPGIYNDLAYSGAILASKINLGLLSKGNRDYHTHRSLEIPSMGGLFCGERTFEHMALYEDGCEAFFWKDASECVDICKELLANDKLRNQVAQKGFLRTVKNNLFNEPVLDSILDELKHL